MKRAINTWAVAVIRYPVSIPDWTKEQMSNMDRNTRKMMTMNGMLHPRVNGSRLYLPREGDRRLISIEVTIETEEYGLSDYVKETNIGHSRLLKSIEKKDTKKEYKYNIKEHRTKHCMDNTLG